MEFLLPTFFEKLLAELGANLSVKAITTAFKYKKDIADMFSLIFKPEIISLGLNDATTPEEVKDKLNEHPEFVNQFLQKLRENPELINALNLQLKKQGESVIIDIKKIELHVHYQEKPKKFTRSIPAAKGFVGREDYLQQLNDWYAAGTRVFVLHGLGGAGKTSLAQKFAEEIGNDYQVQMYLDLQGHTENPLSPANIMLQILKEFDSFDPKLFENIEFEKLQKQYISRLNENNVLLLLDNAKDDNQIEPLNKSNKLCLLVTSRESFLLAGGKDRRITQMSGDDSETLLFSIAEKERFEGYAGELADLAGNLPMALTPLASILAGNDMLSAANLVKKYRDRKEKLSLASLAYRDNISIRASFDLSYETLSDDLKKCWRRLAVFPATFYHDAAEYVCEVESPGNFLEEIIYPLCRYNLLNGDPKTRRYRLHDLARDFLLDKIDDTGKNEFDLISQRHAEFYLHILKKADESIERNNYLGAVNYYELEQTNIEAGKKWARDFAGKNELAENLDREYALYGPELLLSRLSPQKIIEWQEERLNDAIEQENSQQKLDAIKNIGIGYRNLGKYAKARERYKKALALARSLGDRQSECEILGHLGVVNCDQGAFGNAMGFHEKARVMAEELGNLELKTRILSNTGLTLRRLRHPEAIQFYESALELAAESKDRRERGICLGNLGKTYMEFSAFNKAIPLLEEALQIVREFKDRENEGLFLGFLGDACNNCGNKETGQNYLKDSIDILDDLGSPDADMFRRMLGNLGR